MRLLLLPLALGCCFALPAWAQDYGPVGCHGNANYTVCNDGNGGSYTLQRAGKGAGTITTLTMSNVNPNNGQPWSTTSRTAYNVTTLQGNLNGQPFSMQRDANSGLTTYSGQDPDGNQINMNCDGVSCQ